MGPMEDFYDMITDTGLIDAGFEGEPFTWTKKESGKDLTEFFIPKNGLRHSTSLEWRTYQEGCLTTTRSALKRLKLKTRSHRHLDSKICGCTTTPSFKRLNNLGIFLLRDMFSKISEEIGNNLCSIPSVEDIRETVFSIDKDSVAGSDGFSSPFYQACWEFIASDIYEAVRDFFSGTPMPRSFTATTIVLIPKVDSPQSWNDFRPISLCNVINKILSKLLYRRISQALPELISPSQSGFVPGRLISDNILLAQEMIHHLDLRY
ncbi:UNVERIFIED_CONTAM: hypothetical protein Sradi_7062600 [Sesamum radiatum]|uniref:Reverse transcriptase domain-containing protein n=1 Tax=Sesamum radiatum TaxID=300843 RepID=A0AAW2J5W7_SESRA